MQGMLLKMDEWILGLSTPCCNYPALKRSWSISSTAQTLPKHLWSKSGCPFRRFQNVDMKWDEVMKAFKSTTHRPSSVQVPSVHEESTSPRRITDVQNTFRRRNLDGIRWICNVYIYIYMFIYHIHGCMILCRPSLREVSGGVEEKIQWWRVPAVSMTYLFFLMRLATCLLIAPCQTLKTRKQGSVKQWNHSISIAEKQAQNLCAFGSRQP